MLRTSHFTKPEAKAEANRKRKYGYGARVIPNKSATGEPMYGVYLSMPDKKPDSTMCVCPHCKAWNGVNEKTCYRCGYILN